MKNLTPEQQALWSRLRGESLHEIPGLEYDRLLLLLKRHKLLPLTEEWLPLLPSPGRPVWKAELQQWTLRAMLLTEELKRVCTLLEEQGIPPLTVKGPVLAMQLFGQVNGRQYSDIDVIIDRQQVRGALELLEQEGYRLVDPAEPPPPDRWDPYFTSHNFVGLVHREKRVYLELHIGIFALGWMTPEQEKRLFRDPVPFSLSGSTFRTLRPDHNFLYLCYHGAKHMYFRLTWLRDVARALEHQELDHPGILRQARELGIERMLGLSLLLAASFFRTPIPGAYDPLRLSSPWYRRAVRLHRKIIAGPDIVLTEGVLSRSLTPLRLRGISRATPLDWTRVIWNTLFYRQGFLTRLRSRLLRPFLPKSR